MQSKQMMKRLVCSARYPSGRRRRSELQYSTSATSKPKVVVLAGPTAIGKSALSVGLAKALNAEIISLDSVKIYKHMDIGTNKPKPRDIPIHLIGVRSPKEVYSAVDYTNDATQCIADITSRGKVPLFVGGAGQYLAFLLGASGTTAPAKDPIIYNRILNEIERRGDWDATLQHIKKIDPVYAANMSRNTWRRAARVLELFERTGKPISEFKVESNLLDQYDWRPFALRMTPRLDLLRLIDHRVEQMMYAGLIAEVVELLQSDELSPDSTAAMAIGYRQVIDFLARRVFTRDSIRDLILEIMAKSRHLAHHQYNWFKKLEHLQWIDVNRWDMLPKGTERVTNVLKGYVDMERVAYDEMIRSPEWQTGQETLKGPMPRDQEKKFYKDYHPILHIYNDRVPVRYGNPEVTILMNYLKSVRLPYSVANYRPQAQENSKVGISRPAF